MNYSAQDLLNAFQAVDPRVRFVLKNAAGLGYYCILGPSHRGGRDCWVKVERYNGAVALASPLAQNLGALKRPNLSIRQHPLGSSSGPNFGNFDHALDPTDIHQRFLHSAQDFVRFLLRGFQATNTRW